MHNCLTKLVKNDYGEKFVTCALYGTDRCHLNLQLCSGCTYCSVLTDMIYKLEEYEQIAIEAGCADYKRLTQTTYDQAGNKHVSCAFLGTEQCRVHNEGCAAIGAIINQLYAFEEMENS